MKFLMRTNVKAKNLGGDQGSVWAAVCIELLVLQTCVGTVILN